MSSLKSNDSCWIAERFRVRGPGPASLEDARGERSDLRGPHWPAVSPSAAETPGFSGPDQPETCSWAKIAWSYICSKSNSSRWTLATRRRRICWSTPRMFSSVKIQFFIFIEYCYIILYFLSTNYDKEFIHEWTECSSKSLIESLGTVIRLLTILGPRLAILDALCCRTISCVVAGPSFRVKCKQSDEWRNAWLWIVDDTWRNHVSLLRQWIYFTCLWRQNASNSVERVFEATPIPELFSSKWHNLVPKSVVYHVRFKPSFAPRNLWISSESDWGKLISIFRFFFLSEEYRLRGIFASSDSRVEE